MASATPSLRNMMGLVLFLFLFVLFALILAGGYLLVRSPGIPMPIVDALGKPVSGSISEKILISVNGTQQGMFIRGRNKSNPVLLFLHGGPGMPTYFLAETHPTHLEDYFVVCYWEQTGAGLSSASIPVDAVTTERLIQDALGVTTYLKKRFGQEKIYLMGHSWGSFLGIQLAAAHPDDYLAYIGVAQIADQKTSERRAYQFIADQFASLNNREMAQKLRGYDVLSSDKELLRFFRSSLRDDAMHGLGIGTMHTMHSVVSGILIPIIQCKAYTAGEKIRLWRAKRRLLFHSSLVPQLFESNLMVSVPSLDIPVYFITGGFDYTVNTELSREYFNVLQAPEKRFFCFPQSAHCPMHEEPARFITVMRDSVLALKLPNGLVPAH